jgi:hypothetical protein
MSRILRTEGGATVKHPLGEQVKKFGRPVSDFRAEYDKSYIIPKKIKDTLKRLGGGGWAYEVEFAREAGVSLSDLGNYREQFMANIVPLRDSRRAWAGSEATAKQLRGML